MRTCGACRLPLRWDETLRTCLMTAGGGAGVYQACPRCCAAADGVDVPAPRKYPPGQVPRHPLRDDLLPICGCCREALFENERTVPARLFAEDLPQGDDTEPGLYLMCPRCLTRYRPAIARRLIGLGFVPEGTPPEAIGGNQLM